MDFAKFVSLVSTGYLLFARADRLGDPYEGSVPRSNIGMRPTIYKDVLAEPDSGFKDALQKHDNFISWSRQWTFVSCWHANWHESAAMWKIYALTDQAVAIKTRYQTLVEVLTSDIYVGQVAYIDYEKDWMPEGNSFYPFTHKRVSFEYEQEVRAICQHFPESDKPGQMNTATNNDGAGLPVPVALNTLIEAVHVAPHCELWFVEAVRAVMDQFKIDAKIHPSTLSLEPHR